MTTGKPQVVSWIYSGVVVLCFVWCCFPLGLYLVWTHPTWAKGTKFLIFGCWLGLLMIGALSQEPESENAVVQPQPVTRREVAPQPQMREEDQFRDKLLGWTAERERLDRALLQLVNDHKEVADLLAEEEEVSQKARIYAEEMVELQAQVKALWSRRQAFDTAITKAESTLRRLARRNALGEVGITEDALDELSETVLQLDDALGRTSNDPGTEFEIDEILKELGPKNAPDSSSTLPRSPSASPFTCLNAVTTAQPSGLGRFGRRADRLERG